MPTDYGSRNNKGMHTREALRYERGGDRLVGKRDWVRVSSASNPGAENTRAPLLSSFNTGSYEPPTKRRPSGRHGFSGENGRCSSREHPRLPEHQPGMFSASYSTFSKVERYGPPPPPPPPPPPGAMNHFNNHHYPPPSARNGVLRDSLVDDDYYRDRGELDLPAYQPLHGYSTFTDTGSSSFSENNNHHHRGSRYGWPEGNREVHHRERLSSSPDVFDRKVGISRYGGGAGAWGGGGEREIEGRHDRYGASRDAGFRDFRGDVRGSSLDLPDEFAEPFVSSSSRLRGSSLPREEPMSASPRKKTRLRWGDGLASYEQKHVSKVKQEDEHQQPVSSKELQAPQPPPPSPPSPPVAEANGDVKDSKAGDEHPENSHPHSPLAREPTPVRDAPIAVVVVAEASESTEAVAMEATAAAPVEPVQSPALQSPGVLEHQQEEGEVLPTEALPPPGPEAEASAAREEAPESSSGVMVTKVELLLRVEKVEFEIDSIEKELVRLAAQMDLDATLTGEQQSSDQPEQQAERPEQNDQQPEQAGPENVSEEPGEPGAMISIEQEETPVEAHLPAQPELLEITERLTLEFAHLLPEGVRGRRRLYSKPEEAPVWARNQELHQVNKSRILERMAQKQAAVKLQEKSLVLKYRLLREFTRSESSRSSSKPRLLDGESEDTYLMRKVLAEPLCPYRESLRVPAMILDPAERTVQHVVTANRLVEDPVAWERERKLINPWTPEERKVFVEKFAVFYKNFAKIASFLPHKTTGDCVEFYYRNQKAEDLIKLRKKQKKRHYRTSYLATTSASAIQKLASAAGYASGGGGKLSRNQSQSQHFRAAERERLSLASGCVETRSGNFSASIVTGICSLSSDAPLTPSRASCERGFDHHKQKGARSCRGRRESHQQQQQLVACEEVEVEWRDSERELFLDALLMFGKDFRSVAVHVGSRSESQCKTFFSKARKRLKLDKVVEQHQRAQQKLVVAVVNRACGEDDANAQEGELQNSEEMEVSVVVDSGMKEGNEDGDHMEGISAAGGGAPAASGGAGAQALVDSPGSSVITSPGLVSSSSPAIQASNLEEKSAPEMNKPLTEAPVCEAAKSRKRKLEDQGGGDKQNGVWGQEKPGCLPVNLQALYASSQLQVPPVVLTEQQQLMILQHHKQLQQQSLQFLPPQFQQQQQQQQVSVVKQENHLQQQQLHLHHHHYTNNNSTQKQLAAFQQQQAAFFQQELMQKQDQQAHLLNLLAQQQQLALQLHQQPPVGGGFPQQQKVPGLQLLEAAAAGGVNKFLTGEFNGDSLHFVAGKDELQVQRGGGGGVGASDVKLFGKSLLSQPGGVVAAAVAAAAAKGSIDPGLLTKSGMMMVQGSGKPVPFLLGESWCSGSAEAQDRGISNALYNAANGQTMGVSYPMSGALPDVSSAAAAGGGKPASCSREALNLWKTELMKSSSGSFQQHQHPHQQVIQQQHQHQQQQQQQGVLKDGVMFPGQMQMLQFANGGGWASAAAAAAGNASSQQARILAQMTLAAEQQRQSLS